MMLTIPLLFIATLLAIWRKLHQMYAHRKFVIELNALRDEVSQVAWQDHFVSHQWLLRYFDATIAKTIEESYYLTIFRLGMFRLNHKRDEDLLAFTHWLEEEFDGVPPLATLRERYNEAVLGYILAQHFVSYHCLFRPAFAVVKGTAWLGARLHIWAKNVLVYPETSAYENDWHLV